MILEKLCATVYAKRNCFSVRLSNAEDGHVMAYCYNLMDIMYYEAYMLETSRSLNVKRHRPTQYTHTHTHTHCEMKSVTAINNEDVVS